MYQIVKHSGNETLLNLVLSLPLSAMDQCSDKLHIHAFWCSGIAEVMVCMLAHVVKCERLTKTSI